MNKDELNKKFEELDKELQKAKYALIKEYCDSNNPYKIGDVITDSHGSIRITCMERYAKAWTKEDYYCVYGGTPLNKDGSPKKRDVYREIWQNNVIKNSVVE